MRDVYLADTPADAATLLDKATIGCAADEVAEVRSLGKTLASWRTEILAHHDTGASNGPTEGLIIWSRHGGVVDVADRAVEVRRGRVLWSVSLRSPMLPAA
ncbi:hypothetical protein BH24ACT5_BH24ACT5_06800 [soil metagenome]